MSTGKRRVVVTGIGLVSPFGLGHELAWNALLAGQSAVGPIRRFDATGFATRIAAEVPPFELTAYVEGREMKSLDRFVHLALVAAELGMRDSGLQITDELSERTCVYIGSGMGGLETLEKQHTQLRERGPRKISPYFVPAIIVNMASGLVSLRYNIRGPNLAHVSACATSSHSIGEAMRSIALGEMDAAIAGGSEATVTPLGIGGFAALRAMSTRNDDPVRASRPFDKGRDGFVMGEGAAVLILEAEEIAQRRGARIYCELAGYGASSDAFHMVHPPDDGAGAARCMKAALASAQLPFDAVGYINAHGTSTEQGDIAETRAICSTFESHAKRLWVSSTKSMTGHMLGAAGAAEAAFAVLSLHHRVVPPTINLDDPDPLCTLDYVPKQARPFEGRVALSNSFGFGGTNASLIFLRQ